ncbi:MAG: secretin N-terminal domain-containing protein [Myxococcota bacterium]
MRKTPAVALALLLGAGALRARAADEELQLNFKDASPAAVIEAVGRATGTRFEFETPLHGQLTLVFVTKVSKAEALEVLNAALLAIGFAPVPSPDGGFRIVPIEAARGAAPWIHHSVSENSERMVTTLVRLQSADAQDIARQLIPADRSSLVVAYPPTNSLIISAPEDRIAYLLELLRALDQASGTRLEVLPLRYADANAVAAQLSGVFTPKDKSDIRPEVPFKVVVEARTNSLIVEAPPSRQREVRKYVDLVDVPKRSKSGVHVVRVMNADAEQLAQKLSGISFDEPARTASAGSRTGKAFTVTSDAPTNSLLITADAATFALLADVIGELDRIPPRIAVEVSVLVVDTTHALDLGFDALLPLIVPSDVGDVVAFAAFGDPAPLIASELQNVGPLIARVTRKPVLVPIIGPDGTPTTVVLPAGGAQITASQGDATIRNLSNPYLLAASGEEQHIFAGQNVPIAVSSNSAANTGSTTSTLGTTSTTTPGAVSTSFQVSQSIEREDVGIDLRVKPVSLSDHLTAMDLAIEVKSPESTLDSTTGAQLGPTIDQIKIQAHVQLTDGSVALIATSPKDSTENTEQGVPYLRRIPILGWLFKSTSDRVVRRRLVAVAQATQLHSPSEERAEQMERVLAFERRTLRIQPLRALVSEPYALLVATRDSRAAAEQLLSEIADLPGDPLVVEWRDAETPRFDVYLAGFREIAQLGDESVKLRERGFTPRLEVTGSIH